MRISHFPPCWQDSGSTGNRSGKQMCLKSNSLCLITWIAWIGEGATAAVVLISYSAAPSASASARAECSCVASLIGHLNIAKGWIGALCAFQLSTSAAVCVSWQAYTHTHTALTVGGDCDTEKSETTARGSYGIDRQTEE